jgi:hypothetical protein
LVSHRTGRAIATDGGGVADGDGCARGAVRVDDAKEEEEEEEDEEGEGAAVAKGVDARLPWPLSCDSRSMSSTSFT